MTGLGTWFTGDSAGHYTLTIQKNDKNSTQNFSKKTRHTLLWDYEIEFGHPIQTRLIGNSSVLLYVDLRPGQTCHSKDGGSCIFHWRGRAWLTIWDRVKIPRYSHKLMRRKRLTCELHDSYFRSMMIKTRHSKDGGSGIFLWLFMEEIEWAMNYNITQCPGNSTSLETREMEKWCSRENSTQQRARPPGLRLSCPGELERNADGHKNGGQYVAVFVRSSTPSHTQPFQIKWEVYFSKKCVARLYCCVVMHAYAYATRTSCLFKPEKYSTQQAVNLKD